MGGFVFFLIVVAVVLAGNLGKKKLSGTSRRDTSSQGTSGFEQVREQLQALKDQQRRSGGRTRWPAPRVPTDVPPAPPRGWPPVNAGPLPSGRPDPAASTAPPTAGWNAGAWAPAEKPPAQQVAVQQVAAPQVPAPQAVEDVQLVITDLRDDPAVKALLPDPTAESRAAADTRERREVSTSPPERYVGSAALESTLDSTIESSLLGIQAGPTTQSVVAVGRPVDLPQGVEGQVLAFIAAGHDVAAVRLICDEVGCGILDAMRTVDSLS